MPSREDIEAARRRLELGGVAEDEARRRSRRKVWVVRPSRLPELTLAEFVLALLLIVAAVMLPVITIFIVAALAILAHINDQIVLRNSALISFGVCVLILLIVSFAPEELGDILFWVDLSGPLTE